MSDPVTLQKRRAELMAEVKTRKLDIDALDQDFVAVDEEIEELERHRGALESEANEAERQMVAAQKAIAEIEAELTAAGHPFEPEPRCESTADMFGGGAS